MGRAKAVFTALTATISTAIQAFSISFALSGLSIRTFWRLGFGSTKGWGYEQQILKRVKRIESWLDASIKAHQSVGVETVLSTDKYRRLVRIAKKRGFEVRLVYVILQTPELNVDRVRLRVKKGGHRVPIGKIKERWTRSLRQLPWFLNQADAALIFDNSSNLRLVGRKENGAIQFDPETPDALKKALPKFPWHMPIKKKKR
jgi:predicted ABC-type ATPase